MIRILIFLLPFFLLSCSSEENSDPSFTNRSYSAEIGDLITLSGTNLTSTNNVRIFSEEYDVPMASIYDVSNAPLSGEQFTVHTDTEIQFILPELYAKTYTIRAGGQEFPLNVKGFIPLENVFSFYSEDLTGLEVIDDERALASLGKTLYYLENGYHKARKISGDVHFFDFLEIGDSWYAKSSDYESYEIFYSSSGTSSYTLLTTFQKRDFDGLNYDFYDVFVTPEKHIYISSEKGNFLIKDNKIRNIVELYPGLEAYSPKEREVFNFQLTPEGMLYGKLNSSNGFLILDPKNYTFNFTEKFTSNVEGPVFRNNIGYLFLPRENRLYKSTDSGLTWSKSPIFTPTPEGDLRRAKIDVLDANTVMIFFYSSVNHELPFTTVYISRDGGDSWQERKQFNSPKQKEKFVYFSEFTKQSGLLYFTDYTRARLWKYVH